jgi:ComF family protein
MRQPLSEPTTKRAMAFDRWWKPACAVCELAPGPICIACEADFFAAGRARCQVCALPIGSADPVCGRCLAQPPHFTRTTALADYASPVDGMVIALKFSARLDLADLFGQLLARRVRPPEGALVVPVPLAFERMSERGFNQSLQIARAYCSATGARLAADAAHRIRHSAPQQTLALAERRRNIRGAFEATRPLDGAQLLVIDDVMTSGNTLDEMARVLCDAGAAQVHALVVARTP